MGQLVLAIRERSASPKWLHQRAGRSRGSALLSARARAGREHFRLARLLPGSLAEEAASQAAIGAGAVHAAGEARTGAERTIADRHGSSRILRGEHRAGDSHGGGG